MADQRCPGCGAARPDPSKPCPACGAAAVVEHRSERGRVAPVREDDLEPYVALTYIARLFKVLAVVLLVMLIGEIITGIMMEGRAAIVNLLGEATRLLVLAGLLWAAGDLAMLLIDVGHDMRVSRILLGRIESQLDQTDEGPSGTVKEKSDRKVS